MHIVGHVVTIRMWIRGDGQGDEAMINLLKAKKGMTALGATMLASLLCGVARADVRDFEFVNTKWSASIVGAWIAQAGTDEPWRPVNLRKAIAPRSKSQINFLNGEGCMYDLKVRLSNGDEQHFDQVDLCKVARLIVT
jgi:hypothetical protein